MDNSSDISETNENLIARLRRLKMQQSILYKTVAKSWSKFTDEVKNFRNPHSFNDVDLKAYLDKLKTSYNAIKNLYEDIKISTSEDCENIDIQQIKRDIMELECKIKCLKEFIRNELEALKTEDLVSINKAHQNRKPEINSFKPSVINKRITLCSPVKVLIESPFKYSEVQRFQEFLKNSPNRFGGWNEYNHNIFIQLWTKFFTNNYVPSTDEIILCPAFQDEILLKISGLTAAELTSHVKWYLEFLQLKKSQQMALDKWKENRKKIKKSAQSDKTRKAKKFDNETVKKENVTNHSGNTNIFLVEPDSEHYNISKDNAMTNKHLINVEEINKRIMKPTKQWINKCKDFKDTPTYCSDIERVEKLHVPQWRTPLNES